MGHVIDPADVMPGDKVTIRHFELGSLELIIRQVGFPSLSDLSRAVGSGWTIIQHILAPKPLPTEVGAIIMWREDNSAGENVAAFAEFIGDYDWTGVTTRGGAVPTWRRNGFDLEYQTSLEEDLKDKQWVQLVPKEES